MQYIYHTLVDICTVYLLCIKSVLLFWINQANTEKNENNFDISIKDYEDIRRE